jgi:hypothetical protein
LSQTFLANKTLSITQIQQQQQAYQPPQQQPLQSITNNNNNQMPPVATQPAHQNYEKCIRNGCLNPAIVVRVLLLHNYKFHAN